MTASHPVKRRRSTQSPRLDGNSKQASRKLEEKFLPEEVWPGCVFLVCKKCGRYKRPKCFFGHQSLFGDTKKRFLTFSEVNGGLINCEIVLDILEGQKRHGWFFNGRRAATKQPQKQTTGKAAQRSRSSTQNSKSNAAETTVQVAETKKTAKKQKTTYKLLTPHKQQQVVQTAAQRAAKQQQHKKKAPRGSAKEAAKAAITAAPQT